MDGGQDSDLDEVRVVRMEKGDSGLAVFQFQGRLQERMISSLRECYFETGSYGNNSRKVSSQTASSLMLAGVAGVAANLSAEYSSSLFIATANPATLMRLGSGVGSAVMGSGGIVGQAAFLPVASSLPIVAPILAIQVLNTVMVMRQFNEVDKKLDTLKNSLDQLVVRIEATHSGNLIAASEVIDDIYGQYGLEGEFSTDMLVRLSLAERDVSSLASRFTQLVQAHKLNNVLTKDEVTQVNYDAHAAMLATLLKLRVEYLRIWVNAQENPKSVSMSLKQLRKDIDEVTGFWQVLLSGSRAVKEEMAEIEKSRGDLNWLQNTVPAGKAKELDERHAFLKEIYPMVLESERDVIDDFHALIDEVQKVRTKMDSSDSGGLPGGASLVYWQDEAGTHSFVTDRELIS